MTHIECDGCGCTLHHGELWTLTVKRAGAAGGQRYELCASCAAAASSAAHMAVSMARKQAKEGA